LQPTRHADELALEIAVAFSVEVEMGTGNIAMDWLVSLKSEKKIRA
jgi:hypothetical protein